MSVEQPESEPDPWAMQLVARVAKVDPPSRTHVLAAAALAVATLLCDPRSAPNGEWRDPLEEWTSRRIRKHCRRARGAAWERAQRPAGVTVAYGTAQVRAYVPTSVTGIPPDLARLQLQGATELLDPDVDTVLGLRGDLMIAVSTDPFLPWGKAAAAAGHASQLSLAAMDAVTRDRWIHAGLPLHVVSPEPSAWRAYRHSAPVVVRDGGFTVVAPGTVTAVAAW